MHCSEFQNRLQDAIVTRDQTELSQLAAHGETCVHAVCRTLWQEQTLLARAVGAWQALQPRPPRLAERVLREQAATATPPVALARTVPERRRVSPSRSAGWTVTGVAAALLLAAGLALKPSGDGSSLTQSRRGTPAIEAPESHVSHPSLAAVRSASPVETGDSYVHIAREATYFVTDLAMLVVAVDVDHPGESAPPSPGWISRLGEQIEPVKSGVEGKLGEWFGPPAT